MKLAFQGFQLSLGRYPLLWRRPLLTLSQRLSCLWNQGTSAPEPYPRLVIRARTAQYDHDDVFSRLRIKQATHATFAKRLCIVRFFPCIALLSMLFLRDTPRYPRVLPVHFTMWTLFSVGFTQYDGYPHSSVCSRHLWFLSQFFSQLLLLQV